MKYVKVRYEERNCSWCKKGFIPNRRDKHFCTKGCYRSWGKKEKGHSVGNLQNIYKRLKMKKRPYTKHKGVVCARCSFIPEHLCQLDVDHIDGNHANNIEENLQTLCANCHRLKTAQQLGWT